MKVNLSRYVQEILKTAEYKKGEDLDCVVAVAKVLPGCITQGGNYEEARENLIDAIETWILSALMDGEMLPEVNGCQLAIGHRQEESEIVNA